MVLKRKILKGYTATVLAFFIGWLTATTAQASDGYIERKENSWVMGTGLVEKTVVLENGRFFLKSFVDKTTGAELIGADSGEFYITLTGQEKPLTGLSGGWQLIDSQTSQLKQGEQQLSVTLSRDDLQVTKNYVVFPLTSVIREWVVYKNVGKEPLAIANPGFLNFSLDMGDWADQDFHWMTGGGNVYGSWLLYTEHLKSGEPRKFDSFDPTCAPPDIMDTLDGDGVRAKVLHNDKQIWPESGWAYSPHSAIMPKYELEIDVKQGDELIFVVNGKEHIRNDQSEFAPVVFASDGKAFLSWGHFSDKQGNYNWSYYAYQDGQRVEMVFNAGKEAENWQGFDKVQNKNELRWLVPGRSWNEGPYIGWNYVCPGDDYDVARVWTAEKDDKVKVVGSICNLGNPVGSAVPGFKAGSETYAPWYSLFNRKTGQGVFIGWDYFGRWKSEIAASQNPTVSVKMEVHDYDLPILPGEQIVMPMAFTGLYQNDLDEAGNACLDWQYRYLWDYTTEQWCPTIRMVGRWTRGISDTMGVDIASLYRQAFRVADMLRYCGGDVYHRDWGWWDRLGDWNGPDWRSVNDYLKKYDMGLLLYGTLNYSHHNSRIGKIIGPDGYPTPGGYWSDLSKPQVSQAIYDELVRWYDKYGPFAWRNDGGFLSPGPGGADNNPFLGQDQGFRWALTKFLDEHPDCIFQGVNGGGPFAGYEYTRYSMSFSFTDGAVGRLRNYYASLILPPDKTSDFPENAQINNFDADTWPGKLCFNVDFSQDSYLLSDFEGTRKIIDLYHYLHSQGLVGRWVKVYRPAIQGDEKIMYFQRVSSDRKKSILISKHTPPGEITIIPKGLLADEIYHVSYQRAEGSEDCPGSDLMQKGITIARMFPGELIYLNLPMHPGSKRDDLAPTAPTGLAMQPGENMGFPGVELNWEAATDNNWISYYQIWRNGQVIDKVARANYYFDHSTGADPGGRYQVCAVDGAGNTSDWSAIDGGQADESVQTIILDDRDCAEGQLKYEGQWEELNNKDFAFNQTLSRSCVRGSKITYHFTGRKILLFTRMGPDCGQVLVNIGQGDSKLDPSSFGEVGYTYAREVDTYSADDMWDVCVFQQEMSDVAEYTLEITILNSHGWHPIDTYFHQPQDNSQSNYFYMDGLRVE